MTVLDDVQASQATTDTLIAKLAADIVAKIAAISLLGMTPEQQAQLTDVAAHANKINDALSGVDATVATDPAPAPTA